MKENARIFVTVSETAGYKTSDTIKPSSIYNNMLYKCRGKEIEVETDYLFLNQCNTTPIEGVSENGLRLFFTDIKAMRLENCTFDEIKEEIRERYKRDWNDEISDGRFSAWRSVLGISKGMKKVQVANETGDGTHTAWASA